MSWKGSKGSWSAEQDSWGAQQWSGADSTQQWGNSSQQWGGNSDQQWGKSNAGKGSTDAGKGGKGGLQYASQGKGTGVVVPGNMSPAAKAAAASMGTGGKGAAKGGAPGKGGKGGAEGGWNGPKGGWSADGWQKQSWDAAKGAASVEKAKLLAKELENAESMTAAMLTNSKAVFDNENAAPATLKSSLDSLEKHQAKLKELQKSLNAENETAKKAGPSGSSAAAELTKMIPKVTVLWQSVSTKINLVKPKMMKHENEAALKAKEAKDASAFRPVLAKASADATTAEKAANEVTKLAAPLVTTPMEEGEERDSKAAGVEAAAAEAIKKLEAARVDLGEKMKSIQMYAPEAKKSAASSLHELQKKVGDSLKALHVYKSFKKELPKLIESQKIIDEANEKLAGCGDAISKAGEAAKAASVTKDVVDAIDGHLQTVQQAVSAANIILNKLKSADAVTHEKVVKLRAQGEELKKKSTAVVAKIKTQRDVIKAEEAGTKAKDLLAEVEKSWIACEDAEMPFLMGVEMLPGKENDEAVAACQEAAKAAGSAIYAARSYVKKTLSDSHGYEKALGTKTAAELNPIMKKVDDISNKYSKFQKELSERKIVPLLAEAMTAAKSFDAAAKDAEAAGKALDATDLEDQASDKISQLIEKAKEAHAEASTSMNNARNVFSAKLKESKARDNHPSVVSINDSIKKGKDRLDRIRTSMQKAQQVVTTKAALVTGDEKATEIENAIAKAKKLIPAEDGKLSLEKVTALDEACANVDKSLKALTALVNDAVRTAPPKAKADLSKLTERKAAAQVAANEIKSSTRERREAVLGESFLAEAEATTKAAEAAAGKLEEAEQPFLIGKSMDLKATQEQLEKCSGAATAVQQALGAAKNYASSKKGELMQFREEAAKKVKEGFAKTAERLTKVGTKLSAFEKDSKERTKESRMLEAADKADELEACVKKVLAAAEPFTKEGAEDMTEAAAEAPLKAFMEVDQEAQKKSSELANFLNARQREQKGNKTNEEALKTLLERVTKAKEEVAEKKKSTAPHEKRALAKKLLADAKEQVATLEAEVKKATEACAPLFEEGGETFLIANSVLTLVAALRVHMKEKELTVETLFKSIGKGKPIPEKTFVKYLADLPEAIGHDELSAFSEERRQAIFKLLASNDKAVTQTAFAGMFQQLYFCVSPVTLTDKFEVDGGETLCKLEKYTDVQLFGDAKDDANGLTRSEGKVGDKIGWITIKQGKNNFLRLSQPFRTFCFGLDKVLRDGAAKADNVVHSVQSKMKQGGPAEEGPLKEAREEMAKLREEANKALKSIHELKKKLGNEKRTFEGKESADKNAHIEARRQKEAAPFLEGAKAKMEAAEADAKATEEAGAPLVSISGDELKAFATPATVLEAVVKFAAAFKEKADAAREVIKEQSKAAGEVNPQTDGTKEAKSQLKNFSSRLDSLAKTTSKISSSLTKKCDALIVAKLEPVAEAIRKSAQEKSKSIEDLFESLSSGDKIPVEAFCTMLQSLELGDSPLSAETAKLVCLKLEAGGISKETFMKFVVVYYKVARTIAFTDGLDISTCKTVRKAEIGEVVEVLEGPVTVEAEKVVRVRAKAVKDGKVGWITVSGSQGTAFLEKTNKPAAKPAAAAAKP